MPRIGKICVRVDGKFDTVEMHYNMSNSFFVKKIPGYVVVFSDYALSGYQTEAELRSVIQKIFDAYHEKTSKSRKVIVYKIHSTSGITMNKVGPGHYHGSKEWIPKVFSNNDLMSEGVGFVLSWGVYLEVDSNGITFYKLEGEECTHKAHIDVTCSVTIDWTEDREDFFKKIDISIIELYKKFAVTMANEKKLIELISSGKTLTG